MTFISLILIGMYLHVLLLPPHQSVPLLAGSVKHPAKVMPRAIVISMVTLGIIATLTLTLNTSVAPGVEVLKTSSAPLMDGFKALTSNSSVLMTVSALVSVGLIVSFHCFILYAGETVALLACDGILPAFLGTIHPRFDTPHVALCGSSVLGLVLLATSVYWMTGTKAVSVLINVAVVGGLVAYILQFLAYLSRPWGAPGSGFTSPLGRPGAYLGLFLCIVLMACEVWHATKEVTEAEGLCVVSLVFAIALVIYFVWPTASYRRASRAARRRVNSLEAQLHHDDDGDKESNDETYLDKRYDTSAAMYYAYTVEDGHVVATPTESSSAASSDAAALSPGKMTSPQRRRACGSGGAGGVGGAGSAATSLHTGNGYNWCDV